VQVLVRRKPGISATAASTALTQAYIESRARARAINPRVLPDSLAHPRALAGPVKQAAGPDPGAESRVLLWVTGVAFIVLLIACANVANLTFARVIRRRRETTVRLALGVSRPRLMIQHLTEALVLAAIGCGAGMVLAQWGGLAIRNLMLPDGSAFNLFGDWRTISVAAACAVLAVVLTSLGPALLASRTDLGGVLRAGMRGASQHRSRTRASLVVLQGALSTLLLVGAGLFVRSFLNARAVPLGFDAGPVIEVIPDFRGFPMDSAASVAMQQRLLEAARSLPGVTEAARVNSGLFRTNTASLAVDGVDSLEALGRFNMQIASAGYFDVLQIRLLRGRTLSDNDRAGSPRVAVVSESMGRVLWPGKDPIGQCLYVGFGPAAPGRECTTVVGIAENTAQQNLTDDPRYMYYMPVDQVAPQLRLPLLLRMAKLTDGEPERVRRTLSNVMPGDGFVVVRPLQEVVDDQSRSWRIGAILFIGFGALALVVAVVGLYGVISYGVAQRQHELGVRTALGARAGNVVWLVVAQGARLALIGVGLGLILALIAGRWVQPLLFQLSAKDPAILVSVGGGMLLAALAASAIPAVRAARADPNLALRSE
jgi:predicted permease